jgi:S-DNA-T family DNA segregation ATPase FtsK/SpoIIIE
MVDRRAAANVPEGRPGHGLTSAGQHCLVATVDSLGTLAKSVATGWTGPTAAPVRLLPAQIPYSRIEESARTWRLPIGLAETDLGLVRLDLVAEPHLIVFGDAESGKSSLLRMLAATITRRFAPEQARIILVDYRRSLLGAVDGEHLIGYGTSAASTRELIESVAGYLEARLPGPDVTPAQLADRSWWTGPACILLVDDYDLVATGPDNPLLPLVDYLAQGRDLGLHVIVTRRSGGAGRALYDPLLQRLRELPSPGLVLSGDPDEGPLLGQVRPGPLPPGRGRLVTRKEGVRVVQLALPPD